MRHLTHSRWATRHPAKAAEERALRKQVRAIERECGHVAYGTPETRFHAARTRQGSLARLYASGAIDADQLAASAEIAAVHEMIARDVAVRTVSLETRVDAGMRGDGAFFERLGAVIAEVAYTRWRAMLPDPSPVLAMIVDDAGVSAVASRFSMGKPRARKLLTDALDLWLDVQHRTFREIGPADLAAAQAGIL